MDAFEDKDIQNIAWKNYGFRVGTANVDVSGLNGIPQNIPQGAPGLKMDTYNKLVHYLEFGTLEEVNVNK
jgi:hypothetical protein